MTNAKVIKSDSDRGTASAAFTDSQSFVGTTFAANKESTSPAESGTPLTDRDLYPHLFDESSGISAAQVTLAIKEAIIDMEEVADLILEPDFPTAWAALGSAGAKIKRAEQFASFNSALRGICIYCRRAIHKADAIQLDQQSIQAMIVTMRRLANNPTINLAGCAELADNLEDQGWDGNNPLIDEIAEALLNSDQSNVPSPSHGVASGGHAVK
jgi:hypothetical protein